MSARAPARASADVRRLVIETAQGARRAARAMAGVSRARKDEVLVQMAADLRAQRGSILAANAQDVRDARAAGLSDALVDRLTLDGQRIDEMAVCVEAVAGLPDPVGAVLRAWTRPNGLAIEKVRVPLGVIGVIYESRPNVTSDCSSLCVKSGNAVVLRGGSESFRSNRAIAEILRAALKARGLPEAAISVIPVAERAGVEVMLGLDQLIDVIIPRGGESLIRTIAETSRIPVIKHAKGLCHVYVDRSADLAMAQAITFNAKCQRPATCNAAETLLVHAGIARDFLPAMARRFADVPVELRGDERAREIVPGMGCATEADWETEYLDLVLAIRVVDSLEAAVEHIARYGSGHSDAIVTDDKQAADRFVQGVDSAAVYVNASTRFTDGFQFGMGAEMGISTDRLHARGPMALEELTTYKYVVRGTGQIRES